MNMKEKIEKQKYFLLLVFAIYIIAEFEGAQRWKRVRRG